MVQHWLSCGAGVQSSTLAMMATLGEIEPMPHGGVFADTQDEPEHVYEWLAWLRGAVGFKFDVITAGSLSKTLLTIRSAADGRKWSQSAIPNYILNANGKVGKIPGRSCTRDFKITPIIKHVRASVGAAAMKAWRKTHAAALKTLSVYRKELSEYNAAAKKAKKSGTRLTLKSPAFPLEAWTECQDDALVIQWIGISTDEFHRAKPSREPWIKHRFPLIEKRMSRNDCLKWMLAHGYREPPRSACVYCPFHGVAEWRRMQLEEPKEFAKAVALERDLQTIKASTDNMRGVPYLHRSCKPLDTIDFRSLEERGQGNFLTDMIDGEDECEGPMPCGV
jgi:hypothetical protein